MSGRTSNMRKMNGREQALRLLGATFPMRTMTSAQTADLAKSVWHTLLYYHPFLEGERPVACLIVPNEVDAPAHTTACGSAMRCDIRDYSPATDDQCGCCLSVRDGIWNYPPINTCPEVRSCYWHPEEVVS